MTYYYFSLRVIFLFYHFALFMILITPLFASTSIRSPFLMVIVAVLAPIMQGLLISLEIIAAWHVIPPSSVIIALAFFIKGTNSGRVIDVINTSPSLKSIKSLSLRTILALAFTCPLEATFPFNSTLALFTDNNP